ncbi:MAG TPA: metalloregulator ArsR/SmtB family transcription factor [Steroidobacteraceae bacterium]
MQIKIEADDLVGWLRAAGEPTRLRLLALCAQREFSVTDLSVAVGQSGPRVSRHLKILCAAGLLTRLRSGQWVHYRLSRDTGAARFLAGLLADLDPSDPLLAPDRGRVRAAGITSTEDSLGRVRLDEALATFVKTSAGSERFRRLLLVGTEHHALLASAARVAADCTAVAHGRRAAQAASAFIKREHLICRVLVTPQTGEPIEKGLVEAGAQFDALVLDHSSAHSSVLPAWLAAGRQVLESGGRLWLFERYESFEIQRAGASAKPLTRLRDQLTDAGFACERLSPIRAEREQVLAAVAVPARALNNASVA